LTPFNIIITWVVQNATFWSDTIHSFLLSYTTAKMISVLLATAAALLTTGVSARAMDDYVWAKDEHYGWVDMGEEWVLRGHAWLYEREHTWTGYVLNMTSQKWLNDEDYSPNSEGKSIWWHMMVVIVPNEIKWKNNGTLWITGHGMGYKPTSELDEDIALAASLAMGVGCVTGVLFQIPNEDITFASDPIQMSRGEDEIIAFTW
jgi:PhoPQ-activated pathogenicity-related protein